MNIYFYYYLFAVNIFTFSISGLDKLAAKRHRKRVPERVLFLLAIMGGSIGLFISMHAFRHKTKHWYFVIGVPVLIIVQLILLYFLIFFGVI